MSNVIGMSVVGAVSAVRRLLIGFLNVAGIIFR